MDPQKLSQLDPKLREAYQRVMGTVIPEPQAKSDLAQAAPAAQAQTPLPADSAFVATSAKEAASAKVGTLVPAPQPQPEPEPIPAEPTPTPIPEPQPTINPQPEAPPAGEPMPQPAIPPQQASNFVKMNSEVPATSPVPTPNFITPAAFDAAPIQTQTIAVKKKNNILMLTMIGITILVFIVVYSLFWAKIFNFKLPFLP